MRFRVNTAGFLLKLGRFIQSLAIMVMRPDDLVEFSRQFYAKPSELRYWSSEEMLKAGLNSLETDLLNQIPIKTGRVLLLGGGAGRDAFPLARMGFEVTVVDFVPEMVRRLLDGASQLGLSIQGLVQEISQLQVPEGYYDLVWLANHMYSSIPTRQRRVAVLRRISRALKPNGIFFCSFNWDMRKRHGAIVELARKCFAILTYGNLDYEPGDRLSGNAEFLHAFSSEPELRLEFAEGGFEVLRLQTSASEVEGAALLLSSSD